MKATAHFSQACAEARDKLLAAATRRGAKLMPHVHPFERGAAGETLSMDFALLGSSMLGRYHQFFDIFTQNICFQIYPLIGLKQGEICL